MWGGLLTFCGALFHVFILVAEQDYLFLAGVPDKLSDLFSFGERFWVGVIISILLCLTVLTVRWYHAWPDIRRFRTWILLIALVLLVWGIMGAPLNHLNDISHGYSVFHVGAAFFITLTGTCFVIAAWSLREG